MNKILIISIGYPEPNYGASSVLFFYYINAIKKLNHNTTHLIILDTYEVSKEKENKYLQSIKPNKNFKVKIIISKNIKKKKFQKFQISNFELNKNILKFKNLNFDFAICFDIAACWVANKIEISNKLIWLGDLEFLTNYFTALYTFKENRFLIFQLIKSYFMSYFLKKYYYKILKHSDNIIVSSHSSVKQLLKLNLKSKYLPYPWPHKISKSFIKKQSIPSFLIFGTLNALGSKSGISFLTSMIYPNLLKIWGINKFQILICGMNTLPDWAEKKIRKIPEFKFLGYVDDLEELINSCHAVIVPIPVPVGNRSRILTALSQSSIVIAHKNTSKGNPELVSNKNCFLSEDPEQFVYYMKKTYYEQKTLLSLKKNAYKTYSENFNPNVACKKFVKELKYTMNSK